MRKRKDREPHCDLRYCLLEFFGSMQSITTASFEELPRIHGIGEKTARKVYEVFRAGYG